MTDEKRFLRAVFEAGLSSTDNFRTLFDDSPRMMRIYRIERPKNAVMMFYPRGEFMQMNCKAFHYPVRNFEIAMDAFGFGKYGIIKHLCMQHKI